MMLRSAARQVNDATGNASIKYLSSSVLEDAKKTRKRKQEKSDHRLSQKPTNTSATKKISSDIKSKTEEKILATRIKETNVSKKIKHVIKEPPVGWKEIWDGIEMMRSKKDAEVDVDGAEIFYDKSYLPHIRRFHVLISAMLSSQTKDPVNAAAMRRLIARGLTVENMIEIEEKELAQIIRPVGFFNNKAKYIKQTAEIIKKMSNNGLYDIPNNFDDLVALPGVGPKMAYLVMDCAWKKTVGICVDTHVHRISNRLGWAKTWNKKNPKAQDPEKTREELESWLPREHWGSINILLVGFGQTICYPRAPKCEECKVNQICPSAFKNNI